MTSGGAGAEVVPLTGTEATLFADTATATMGAAEYKEVSETIVAKEKKREEGLASDGS